MIGVFNKEKDITVDRIKGGWDTLMANPLTRFLTLGFPLVIVPVFYVCFSSERGNLLAFVTFTVALWFIVVSVWILVWILRQDCGDESMISIADTIKEGSEGFF